MTKKKDDEDEEGEELEEVEEEEFEDVSAAYGLSLVFCTPSQNQIIRLTPYFLCLQDTDYNATYFDNGENYGADEDDDLDEGAIYS